MLGPGWTEELLLSMLVDWKDFRYSVCHAHQWIDDKEDLDQVFGSFKAWLGQEDTMKTTQEIDEDVTNIIDFKEVQAKMGSKLPPDGNWIKDFKAGTRFLAYMKMNASSVLGDFILGTDPKELPAIYLGYENGPQGFGWKWHDPVKFCKEFGLFSILEVSDGNSNTVSDGTVEGDGQLKVIPSVHETE